MYRTTRQRHAKRRIDVSLGLYRHVGAWFVSRSYRQDTPAPSWCHEALLALSPSDVAAIEDGSGCLSIEIEGRVTFYEGVGGPDPSEYEVDVVGAALHLDDVAFRQIKPGHVDTTDFDFELEVAIEGVANSDED